MEKEYSYTAASESELDELMVGHPAGVGMLWSKYFIPQSLSSSSIGVLWKRVSDKEDLVQPSALVCREEDVKRLCGRYAQLRSDLSPLTAWCHLLTPEYFKSMNSLSRDPDLGGLEAAWTGLVVAEALLLSDRALASIRIPACLATQTFAIARSWALWNDLPNENISQRFKAANRLCRSDSAGQKAESRSAYVRKALEPIWACLESMPDDKASYGVRELEPVVRSLRALARARLEKDAQEAWRFAEPLSNSVVEAEDFRQLTEMAPELRLRLFDKLVSGLNSVATDRESLRRTALALLAGYLATVAAGGAPSLALAEGVAQRWPDVTAWAYAVGGIGERVVWTSSFDGLGRLVARELMRPFRMDEPPICDFALDEGAALADPKLADPLVHLRVKTRIVTVALVPGVNITIPIADLSSQEVGKRESTRPARYPEAPDDPIAVLAEAIWPYLKTRMESRAHSIQQDSEDTNPDVQRGKGKRRPNPQSQLPLSGSHKK